MTDISESGTEPCPHGHEQRSLGMVVVPVAEGNAPRWYVRCMDCSATGPRTGTRETAIAAWNRRHPPASREEGLRVKALEWGKEYSERTDGSGYFSVEAQTIVGRYSAYRMDATKQWILEFEREVLGTFDEVAAYRAAAQEHYTNAILSAIETESKKPE